MKIKKILTLLLAVIIMGTTFVYATETDIPEGTNLIQPRTVESPDGVMPISETYTDEYDVEDNDYFDCNQSIDLSNKQVLGNIFVVAEKVKLSNIKTTGSIFVVGQNVEISNVSSDGSCYIVGQNIETKDTDCKNIYSVSENLNLLEGTVLAKNLYSFAQRATFKATVNEEANVYIEEFDIGENSMINGNLNILSKEKPKAPESAIIGNVNFKLIDEDNNVKVKEFSIVDVVVKIIAYVLSTVAVTFIILKAMKSFGKKAQDSTIGSLIKNALFGLLAIIIVPILAILLMVTNIGLRLGLIAFILYVLAFFIATPVACTIISEMIAKKQDKLEDKNILIYSAIVGLAVAILQTIPVISGLVTTILGLVGIGTIIKLPFSKEIEKTE